MRKTTSLVLIAFLVASLALSTGTAVVHANTLEFIANGGFESGTLPWYASVSGMMNSVVANGDTVSGETVSSHTGTHCLGLGYMSFERQNLTIPVPAKVVGTIGFWGMVVGGGTGLFQLTIIYDDSYDPMGLNIGNYASGFGGLTTSWAFFNFTDLVNVNIDPTKNIIAIQIEFRADSGVGLFDDVTILDDPVYYNLDVNVVGSGSTNATGTHSYLANSYVFVQETPGSQAFTCWYANGSADGSANPYQLIMDNNYNITALFGPEPTPTPTPTPTPPPAGPGGPPTANPTPRGATPKPTSQPFTWPWNNWNFPWNNKAHSVAIQVLVNGKAAPGAEVYFGPRYDVADVDGKTMFTNLATGTYGLTASYTGAILDKSFYVERDMQITIELGSKTVQVTYTPDYWWLLILLLAVVAIATYAYYKVGSKKLAAR